MEKSVIQSQKHSHMGQFSMQTFHFVLHHMQSVAADKLHIYPTYSIVMTIQQEGIFSLPEGYKEKYGSYFPLHLFLVYSLQYKFYTQLYVNNVEVTVNTCIWTVVFTVITATKDQSDGIYNSYSTGGQRFMAVSKQTLSSGLVCLLQ